MLKKWAPLLLLPMLLLPCQALAETPDENGNCSGSGAAQKREDALNKMQSAVFTNGGAQQQAEYNLCMRSEISKIMQTASGFGSNIGGIMRMAQDVLCRSQEDNMFRTSSMFNVSNLPSGFLPTGSSDPLTRQLMSILQREFQSANQGRTVFRVPDVSLNGVNNIMSQIIRNTR